MDFVKGAALTRGILWRELPSQNWFCEEGCLHKRDSVKGAAFTKWLLWRGLPSQKGFCEGNCLFWTWLALFSFVGGSWWLASLLLLQLAAPRLLCETGLSCWGMAAWPNLVNGILSSLLPQLIWVMRGLVSSHLPSASGVFKIIVNPFESVDTSELTSSSSPSTDLSTSMSVALSQASYCSSMASLQGSSSSLFCRPHWHFCWHCWHFPIPPHALPPVPATLQESWHLQKACCLLLSELFFSLRQWLEVVTILLLMKLAQTLFFMPVPLNSVNLSAWFFNRMPLGMPSRSGQMPLSQIWHSTKPFADAAWATSRVL